MKSIIWQRSLRKYIIPYLPGTWDIAKTILYREPADWILCYLSLKNSRWSSDYAVYQIVQLLAVPAEYQTGFSMIELGRASGREQWPAANNLAQAQPAMQEILKLIQAEALPTFDRLGSIPGYAAFAEARALENPQNHLYHEHVVYMRLIQGDTAGAAFAAEAVHRAANADGREFSLQVSDRVSRTMEAAHRSVPEAIEMLRANAAYTRKHLGLPPTSEAAP